MCIIKGASESRMNNDCQRIYSKGNFRLDVLVLNACTWAVVY